MRNELTEEQITTLMQAIPRAEMVDRLRKENERMRKENERLRADLATQQGCCDGAAAQDAHVRQEREEHRAEVERLRREIKNLREAMQNLAERLEVDPSGTDKIDDLEAEIERLREGNERLRKALQDIAEDCDDDYPPSHGAIKYAVQDALRDKP